MGKTIHNAVLSRRQGEPWGFRIVGGKDEGLSFKIGKVMAGSPADEAGLKAHDFLISVTGKDVFDMAHNQVVAMIKQAGNSLNITVERGDHIVPNFEEIWPTGKAAARAADAADAARLKPNPTGMSYVLGAMKEGVPGSRGETFSTVGKPKIDSAHQYDNPIGCYSTEMLREMGEKGNWKMNFPQGGNMGLAPGVGTPGEPFNPATSAVMAMLKSGR